jgi:hypothetical protein
LPTIFAPPRAQPRYRSIPEPEIMNMLLLSGWVFECAAGQGAAAFESCAAALRICVARGLGFAIGGAGVRLFDPAEVLAFIIAAGLGENFPVWEARFVRTARALYQSCPAAPQSCAVSLTRTVNVEALPPQSNRARITLPIPIACAYVENPVATIIAPNNLEAEIDRRDTCFDIRLKTPPTAALSFTAHFTFTAPARPAPQILTDPERRLYLRPAENFIRITPRVEARARALAAGAPENTVAAFWNFLLDHVRLCMVQYAFIPADAPGDWVLENRWCDCLLAASLFISLCRAQDIPARLIGGHVLYPLAPTNHYWAECWLGGAWVPYDFLAWDVSAAGRDPAWRDVFAGRCNARMVTEIFPTRFTGPMTSRLPAAWHLVQTRIPGGIASAFHNALTGALIYRDEITIAPRSPPAASPGR